jgi:nitrogen regulatory protein PII
MKRLELIANASTQEDIQDALEAAVDRFYYSVIPVVHGRGRQLRRLGTATWPEENFMLISYVEDTDAETVRGVLATIKARFPTDGIKFFILSVTE